ncbi:hypothetical protein Vretimale_134 [Volvox reticuliferus]|uniref:Apple domain-containing protein n=2 Tax=Volvox reticuliferus TaxID=1737510 RepID=A0A8J4D6N2_9CHLO|nr:hypothetical protein Vretimale_134 [Volvox reticuliferus]
MPARPLRCSCAAALVVAVFFLAFTGGAHSFNFNKDRVGAAADAADAARAADEHSYYSKLDDHHAFISGRRLLQVSPQPPPPPPPPTRDCQEFAGYIAVPRADHNGDDITNSGSAVAAAKECSRLPECKGFNSNGWVKRIAVPVAPHPSSVCFYTKIPDPPSSPSPPPTSPSSPPPTQPPPSSPTRPSSPPPTQPPPSSPTRPSSPPPTQPPPSQPPPLFPSPPPPPEFACVQNTSLSGVQLAKFKLGYKNGTDANIATCRSYCVSTPGCKGFYYKSTFICYLMASVLDYKQYGTSVIACIYH